ncbi:MAG: hypothetical protein K2X93_04740 [Candidatus Obscuribacterales bacterium]|nr:hypothetical protein [Candidatus Obscuribacterales bacterium]
MSSHDHIFKLDRQGRHVVVFPHDHKRYIPPQNYEDRLNWIRKSFDSFISVVEEKRAVTSEFRNKD